MIPTRIVGEVSRNWAEGHEAHSYPIADSFEELIETNRKRGFSLESWRMTSTAVKGGINETIVAVFVHHGRHNGSE